MKKPKVEPLNLPYASSIASFFGDQQGAQGNSFLGRFFNNGQRRSNTTNFVSPASTTAPRPYTGNGGGNGGNGGGDRSGPTSPRPRPNPRLN